MTVETTEQEKGEVSKNTLNDGVKLLGEVVLTPGASLLLDGNIKAGMGHVVVGMLARVIFGFPGALLVAADSYSESVTGKSLLANITGKSK